MSDPQHGKHGGKKTVEPIKSTDKGKQDAHPHTVNDSRRSGGTCQCDWKQQEPPQQHLPQSGAVDIHNHQWIDDGHTTRCPCHNTAVSEPSGQPISTQPIAHHDHQHFDVVVPREAEPLIQWIAQQQYIQDVSCFRIAPQADQLTQSLQVRHLGAHQGIDFLKMPPLSPKPKLSKSLSSH